MGHSHLGFRSSGLEEHSGFGFLQVGVHGFPMGFHTLPKGQFSVKPKLSVVQVCVRRYMRKTIFSLTEKSNRQSIVVQSDNLANYSK